MQTFLWTLISLLLIQRSKGVVIEGNANLLFDQCGVPPKDAEVPLILGNDEAEPAPWMADIRNAEKHICDGTVIHKRFVLAAAHCIDGQTNLFVMLGAQEYNASRAILHRGYSRELFSDNIGLIELSRNIEFGVHVYPICIIVAPRIKRQVDSIEIFDAYSWQKTSSGRQLLIKVAVDMYDHTRCQKFVLELLTCSQLCAKPRNAPCSTQQGSVNPLTKEVFVNGNKLLVQFGIESFGQIRCNGMTIYTDVTSYFDWIARIIETSSY